LFLAITTPSNPIIQGFGKVGMRGQRLEAAPVVVPPQRPPARPKFQPAKAQGAP